MLGPVQKWEAMKDFIQPRMSELHCIIYFSRDQMVWGARLKGQSNTSQGNHTQLRSSVNGVAIHMTKKSAKYIFYSNLYIYSIKRFTAM